MNNAASFMGGMESPKQTQGMLLMEQSQIAPLPLSSGLIDNCQGNIFPTNVVASA